MKLISSNFYSIKVNRLANIFFEDEFLTVSDVEVNFCGIQYPVTDIRAVRIRKIRTGRVIPSVVLALAAVVVAAIWTVALGLVFLGLAGGALKIRPPRFDVSIFVFKKWIPIFSSVAEHSSKSVTEAIDAALKAVRNT